MDQRVDPLAELPSGMIPVNSQPAGGFAGALPMHEPFNGIANDFISGNDGHFGHVGHVGHDGHGLEDGYVGDGIGPAGLDNAGFRTGFNHARRPPPLQLAEQAGPAYLSSNAFLYQNDQGPDTGSSGRSAFVESPFDGPPFAQLDPRLLNSQEHPDFSPTQLMAARSVPDLPLADSPTIFNPVDDPPARQARYGQPGLVSQLSRYSGQSVMPDPSSPQTRLSPLDQLAYFPPLTPFPPVDQLGMGMANGPGMSNRPSPAGYQMAPGGGDVSRYPNLAPYEQTDLYHHLAGYSPTGPSGMPGPYFHPAYGLYGRMDYPTSPYHRYPVYGPPPPVEHLSPYAYPPFYSQASAHMRPVPYQQSTSRTMSGLRQRLMSRQYSAPYYLPPPRPQFIGNSPMPPLGPPMPRRALSPRRHTIPHYLQSPPRQLSPNHHPAFYRHRPPFPYDMSGPFSQLPRIESMISPVGPSRSDPLDFFHQYSPVSIPEQSTQVSHLDRPDIIGMFDPQTPLRHTLSINPQARMGSNNAARSFIFPDELMRDDIVEATDSPVSPSQAEMSILPELFERPGRASGVNEPVLRSPDGPQVLSGLDEPFTPVRQPDGFDSDGQSVEMGSLSQWIEMSPGDPSTPDVLLESMVECDSAGESTPVPSTTQPVAVPSPDQPAPPSPATTVQPMSVIEERLQDSAEAFEEVDPVLATLELPLAGSDSDAETVPGTAQANDGFSIEEANRPSTSPPWRVGLVADTAIRACDPFFLFAVIEVGCNGIRCSLTDMGPFWGAYSPAVFEHKIKVVLFSPELTGSRARLPIPPVRLDELAEQVACFRDFCRRYNVPDKNSIAFADQHFGDAPEAVEIGKAVYLRTGWKIQVITPHQEATMLGNGAGSAVGFKPVGLAINVTATHVTATWIPLATNPTQPKMVGASRPIGSFGLARRLEAAIAKDGDKRGDEWQKVADWVVAEMFELCKSIIRPRMFQSHPAFHTPKVRVFFVGSGLRSLGRVMLRHTPSYPISKVGGFQVSGCTFLASYRTDVPEGFDGPSDLVETKAREGGATITTLVGGSDGKEPHFLSTLSASQARMRIIAHIGTPENREKVFGLSRRALRELLAVALITDGLLASFCHLFMMRLARERSSEVCRTPQLQDMINIRFCAGGIRQGLLQDLIRTRPDITDALRASSGAPIPDTIPFLNQVITPEARTILNRMAVYRKDQYGTKEFNELLELADGSVWRIDADSSFLGFIHRVLRHIVILVSISLRDETYEWKSSMAFAAFLAVIEIERAEILPTAAGALTRLLWNLSHEHRLYMAVILIERWGGPLAMSQSERDKVFVMLGGKSACVRRGLHLRYAYPSPTHDRQCPVPVLERWLFQSSDQAHSLTRDPDLDQYTEVFDMSRRQNARLLPLEPAVHTEPANFRDFFHVDGLHCRWPMPVDAMIDCISLGEAFAEMLDT